MDGSRGQGFGFRRQYGHYRATKSKKPQNVRCGRIGSCPRTVENDTVLLSEARWQAPLRPGPRS